MDALAVNDVISPVAGVNGAPPVGVAAQPVATAPRAEGGPSRSSEAAPLSIPPEPASLLDSGLPKAELESLVLKILLQRGACTGGVISEIVCLPRSIVSETLDRIRTELLVTIKSSSGIQ